MPNNIKLIIAALHIIIQQLSMKLEYKMKFRTKQYNKNTGILVRMFLSLTESTINKFVLGATKPKAAPEKIAFPS